MGLQFLWFTIGTHVLLYVIYCQLRRIADYHQVMLEIAKTRAGLYPTKDDIEEGA